MSFQQIKDEAGQKPVILVEGRNDIFALSYFFDHVESGWDSVALIKAAGDKNRVQKWVKRASNWVGIVDKDEWSTEKINELAQDSSKLHILPRFCIENYFGLQSHPTLNKPYPLFPKQFLCL